MDMVTNPPKLAGGILKFPMALSRVVPCFTKNVFTCATIMLGTNVATRIGIILSICLVSSTWVTGHSFHELLLGPVFTQALFRNLHICYNQHIKTLHTWIVHQLDKDSWCDRFLYYLSILREKYNLFLLKCSNVFACLITIEKFLCFSHVNSYPRNWRDYNSKITTNFLLCGTHDFFFLISS